MNLFLNIDPSDYELVQAKFCTQEFALNGKKGNFIYTCCQQLTLWFLCKAPFSLSRYTVPVHPGLMIGDEPCHNRGGTVDNLGDPG